MAKRGLRCLILLALAGMAVAGAFAWTRSRLAVPGPSHAATVLVFAKGEGVRDISRRLGEEGVVGHSWLFLAEALLSGRAPLQAGEYSFPPHASMATVLDMMRRGQVVVHRLTVAEGLTARQVVRELLHADGLTGEIAAPPDEGWLMPQTYFYTFGESREALLSRMRRAMHESLDEMWPKRQPDSGLADKTQALILASIVERETALPEERPHIAAVFLNRLKLGMKLQSDPTAIYAASQGEGVLDHPLTRAELTLDNPFNTYVANGLPPAPICNPGLASLKAVLNPTPSDDLYFVADGTGGHTFAKTLSEHNKNVERLRDHRHSPDMPDPGPHSSRRSR